MPSRPNVIVVTGGPGGGKTTALDLFQRELKSAGKIVPEAAVIFFQTAAIHGEDVKSNNPYRTEDSRTAVALDEKLQRVWSRHPNFHFIPAQLSFMAKINHGLETIAGVSRKEHSRRGLAP